MNLKKLIVLIVMTVLCLGGTFSEITCSDGDGDRVTIDP